MELLDRFFNEPFQHLIDRLLAFMPHLFAATMILLAGFVVGWLAKVLLRKILGVLRFDSHAERGGLSGLLKKGGVREAPSGLLANFTGGVVVFAFFLIALSNLNLKILDQLIERVFNYLPNVLVAIIIVVIGYLLGNFFGRAALIAAVNAGVRYSRYVGRCVRGLIVILATLIALEQLGIGKESVLLTSAILFSGIVLALAIAFGLGGRNLAREYLERKLKDRHSGDDLSHL